MLSFILLLILIVVTTCISFLYNSTAVMLLTYLEAAYFVISLVSVLFFGFSVDGSMEVPVGLAEKGKENIVKITVTNKAFIPIMRMKALVVVRDFTRKRKIKYWMTLPVVNRGENSFIKGIAFSGTGNYEVKLKKLRVFDITGLLYMNVRAKGREYIQVMPGLYSVSVQLTSAIKNFYGESDIYDEHTAGYDNSELFQVRPYQGGDRLQNIHWKLTAKQDDIMVKEHSLPKTSPVILFLHFSGKTGSSRMVSYLEAAASISFSLMDAGCSHYIAWYDGVEMDIKRVRVMDEESLFYFIGVLMNVKWVNAKENLLDRYKEKYRREPYVWALSLDEKLILKKQGEILASLSAKNIEKSLSDIELLL